MQPLTALENDRLWRLLEHVQAEVSGRVTYRTDLELYKRADFWTVAIDAGDCEDFALAKRQALLTAGFPLDRLSLAVCDDETGAGHAVLLAELNDGGYALDNRQDLVTPWRALPYRWILRQVPGALAWQTMGERA